MLSKVKFVEQVYDCDVGMEMVHMLCWNKEDKSISLKDIFMCAQLSVNNVWFSAKNI